MFDSLRKSFTRFSKTLAEKDLSESDIEEILEDLEMSLLQSDVALEVVEDISSDLKRQLVGVSVNKKQLESFVKGALSESVSQLFQKTGSLDLLERIREKNENDEPYTIVFLGINGTGKTTTLAKFAHMLKKNKLTVVIAAADTFRAGAIEQIRKHGERLQVKIIAQNYNSDPAAVCRDATLYAKSHRINCVLIDTAGRIQTSTNLMQQIEKITKVVNPDLKIFVGDSLAGNDAISQAREFHEYTDFDCSILTKSDADTKGGSALSIVKITSKPILYLGVGQEYPDLKEFRWESFVESVLGERDSMDGELAAKIQTVLETPPAVNTSTHDTAPEVVTSPESADVLESEAKGEIDEDIVKEESEEIQESEDVDIDPFEGIDDADIAAYSDIHDVPPPESDNTARVLAAEIKEWISQGRPISDGPSISEKSVKHERDVTDQSDDTAETKGQEVVVEIEDGQPTKHEDDQDTEQKPRDITIDTTDEVKQELYDTVEVKSEGVQVPEGVQESEDVDIDPFEGIDDADIAAYSDIHDVPPPESDNTARVLAAEIKEWISQGRPISDGPSISEKSVKHERDVTDQSDDTAETKGQEVVVEIEDGQPTKHEDDQDTEQKPRDITIDTTDEVKQELYDTVEVKSEGVQVPEGVQESEDADIDPFEGIDDSDIATYSDIHDVPPPESDNTARVLAAEIKEWISQGRPISDGPSISEKSVKHERDVTDQSDDTAEDKDDETQKAPPKEKVEPKVKDMSESEEKTKSKHKKKRGLFGFFGKK